MRARKFLGPVFGLILSLGLAASVFASGSSSGTVTNANPGWNTPTFNGISNTTFQIWSCKSSSSYGQYDWMHHWPMIPSTGTQRVNFGCYDNTTHHYYKWTAGGTADYSVEYTNDNHWTITDSWSANY